MQHKTRMLVLLTAICLWFAVSPIGTAAAEERHVAETLDIETSYALADSFIPTFSEFGGVLLSGESSCIFECGPAFDGCCCGGLIPCTTCCPESDTRACCSCSLIVTLCHCFEKGSPCPADDAGGDWHS